MVETSGLVARYVVERAVLSPSAVASDDTMTIDLLVGAVEYRVFILAQRLEEGCLFLVLVQAISQLASGCHCSHFSTAEDVHLSAVGHGITCVG